MSILKFGSGVFDTIFDTNQDVVTNLKFKIIPHTYVGINGKSQLFLFVSTKGNRIRLPLKIYVTPKSWNKKRQISSDYDTNLLLGQIMTRANNILIRFRLSETTLTLSRFKEEFTTNISYVSFYVFWRNYLENEKALLAPNTYRNQKSTLRALESHRKELYFSDITDEWLQDFIKFQTLKHRKKTTIATYLKDIKKYVKAAMKKGIKIPLDLDVIKVRRYPTSRVHLTALELNNLDAYFHSEYFPKYYLLPLGLFLFSCYTSARLGDCLQIDKDSFSEGIFTYQAGKTKKPGRLRLNNKAKKILKRIEPYLTSKPTEQHINRCLKEICKARNISKRVTFHVARHTFATLFLKVGGRIENLQEILQHANIKDTMIYVHIVRADLDEDIMLLDKL